MSESVVNGKPWHNSKGCPLHRRVALPIPPVGVWDDDRSIGQANISRSDQLQPKPQHSLPRAHEHRIIKGPRTMVPGRQLITRMNTTTNDRRHDNFQRFVIRPRTHRPRSPRSSNTFQIFIGQIDNSPMVRTLRPRQIAWSSSWTCRSWRPSGRSSFLSG